MSSLETAENRARGHAEKSRAAMTSVAAAILLTGTKIIVGFATGS